MNFFHLDYMMHIVIKISFEKVYTWWDYRRASFRRNHGLRIDHILVSSDLLSKIHTVSIEKEIRKHRTPSDHAPVMMQLNV